MWFSGFQRGKLQRYIQVHNVFTYISFPFLTHTFIWPKIFKSSCCPILSSFLFESNKKNNLIIDLIISITHFVLSQTGITYMKYWKVIRCSLYQYLISIFLSNHIERIEVISSLNFDQNAPSGRNYAKYMLCTIQD